MIEWRRFSEPRKWYSKNCIFRKSFFHIWIELRSSEMAFTHAINNTRYCHLKFLLTIISLYIFELDHKWNQYKFHVETIVLKSMISYTNVCRKDFSDDKRLKYIYIYTYLTNISVNYQSNWINLYTLVYNTVNYQ